MSAYLKLSTGEYPRHIGDIQIDPAGMADYAPVQWVDPPEIDHRRQRLSEGKPTQISGAWKMRWVVSQIPDSEEAARVREERDERLAECNWTQLEDAPLTTAQKAAWADYRQALRDITEQPGFPWDVVWPTQP